MKRISVRSLVFFLVLIAMALPGRAQAPASSIAGDWLGTLSAGGASLRLALHIVAKDGNLTATLDSLDQGAIGIPVSSIELRGSQLTLGIPAVGGTYTGTVNKDASQIDGTWSQGTPLPLTFQRAPAAKPVAPSEIDGLWSGLLDAGAIKLHIVLRLTNTGDGLTAQLQSPDQNPAWIAANSVNRTGSDLKIEFKAIGATFAGKIAADLTNIDGTFSQGGAPMPLRLTRTKQAALERRRPQNPSKPYPYREELVSFTNPVAGNTLAATMTLPEGKGPFPAAVLICGSGPHDRDESLMGHSPFLVLSDALTRRGIAVLRYDKRGIGKSTGDYAKATTADFATDAAAAVTYLRTRSEIGRIGLIGHSEGGEIAPMVAAQDKKIAYIVLMAGSGVPGDQIIAEQARLIEAAAGASKEKIDADSALEHSILHLVETEKDPAELEKKLHAQLAGQMPEAQIDAQIKAALSPWFRAFLSLDPAVALRQVKCPVLVLNGSLDLQVPPALNLPAIRKALAEAGNQRVEIDELPGLNHLFQTAKTGTISEYAEIEETIAPAVLEKIGSWILKESK